jgi:hypothetical protein
MTVGPGIAPGLHDPSKKEGARGLAALAAYRRWGISPRPENSVFLAGVSSQGKMRICKMSLQIVYRTPRRRGVVGIVNHAFAGPISRSMVFIVHPLVIDGIEGPACRDLSRGSIRHRTEEKTRQGSCQRTQLTMTGGSGALLKNVSGMHHARLLSIFEPVISY